jgi:hypothetical protein
VSVTFTSITGAFSPITVGPAEIIPTQLDGVPDGTDSVTFRFEGPELRAKMLELSQHQANRISGGQPRRNLSGYRDAVADPGAQMVTVTWTEGSERSVTGIYRVVSAQVGSGGHRRQTFSVILYPCDRLRFYGMTTFQELPPEEPEE